MSFTWIPIYAEIARKLLEFEQRQGELLEILSTLRSEGHKVVSTNDRDGSEAWIPLTVIDPFTFFASFNRTSSKEGRQAILGRLKTLWNLEAGIPEDFDGIPLFNPQNSWAFGYADRRNPEDIPLLWKAAREGLETDWRTFDRNLFGRVVEIRKNGIAKLSIGLFWMNPRGFLPLELHTRRYFKERGVVPDESGAEGYFAWVQRVVDLAGTDFPQISLDAYQAAPDEAGDGADDQSGNGDLGEEDGVGPRFVRYFGPILDVLRGMGGSGAAADVVQGVAAYMEIPDAELGERMKSGGSRFRNQVNWARFYLNRAGCVASGKRGVWSLTPKGADLRLSHPEAMELFRSVQEQFDRSSAGGEVAPGAGDALGAPFDDIFNSLDEAEIGFELVADALTGLGVDPSNAGQDRRISLTLVDRGAGPRIRLNFGNWAILTFLPNSRGDARVEYLCREDWVPQLTTAVSHTGPFADAVNGHRFVLATGPYASLRDPAGIERRLFRESLALVAKRFADWEGTPYRNAHEPRLLELVFDPARREQVLGAGLELDSPGENEDADDRSAPVAYWWLNVNPKIWDIRKDPIGSLQTYSSINASGNKRQKFAYFGQVKPGDVILGYITSPDREIVAQCEVTKSLHTTAEGEVFEFRKTEDFPVPVSREELLAVADLGQCEPLVNNQGSLFAVTAEEFAVIRALVDEKNVPVEESLPKPFTLADALDGLFMSEADLQSILGRLSRKKALILQGPPGVGKTFVARRLAFAMMGVRDERRVAMVQFHPSYGYEEFVQGYRPSGNGLERRNGLFHQFVRLARNDPGHDWFFIIDEINRGNLAKIFGELLMLIEADKRGPEHAIPLTYSEGPEETFHIPANVHFIGTMNTADRSLAMVDYALRRRFAFQSLRPAFGTEAFATWLIGQGAPSALVERIRDRLGRLNDAIDGERDLGPGFRVGHSFFCPPEQVVPDDNWYREIIESEVQPLLEEYFDSPERVQALVADLLG